MQNWFHIDWELETDVVDNEISWDFILLFVSNIYPMLQKAPVLYYYIFNGIYVMRDVASNGFRPGHFNVAA